MVASNGTESLSTSALESTLPALETAAAAAAGGGGLQEGGNNGDLMISNVPSSENVSYVQTMHGLFPLPLGKSFKLPQLSRLKSKFKFLGRFMAKAVMDSRMVCIDNKQLTDLYFYTDNSDHMLFL